MEDQTGRICAGAGRTGVWYVMSDGFDSVWPALEQPGIPVLPQTIPERGGVSRSAMYLSVQAGTRSGSSASECWGSGLGFDLNYDGASYGSYDASAYEGFAFWARGTAGLVVEARASTIATTLTTYGGTCPLEFCDPYFYAVTLSTEWTWYKVLFSELKHLGWQGGSDGGPFTYAKIDFDKQQLTNIQFLVHKYSTCNTYPAQFEFWIDDVTFR